ncbi:cytochrome c oxidase assembly factor 6 homolog [Scyliorhinus canicula]|uniref:cytochrome c oxidase assembly factor 6 homolog n=1 Tax=Scyliorhinus canicula TaxID=7830 RepID=UPI0018F746F5|nr:cytochrome c oxidase assembly factor 6 homolog [Scyliorhinus canicula]XP_038671647.1 cytochrome c oxidase assembly factor 6 homolog [Scyliorhinus canicula]XP_038671653.1 cytochrome c oxidase assembly factor 6 homolog [Scyliorhinus canicula]
MTAPTAQERKTCWGARDRYWQCLDESDKGSSECRKLRTVFEGSCPQQWINYFDKRRDYLKYKEKMQREGFQPQENVTKL